MNDRLPSISPVAALPALGIAALLIAFLLLPRQDAGGNLFVAALATQLAFFMTASLSALCSPTPFRRWFSFDRAVWRSLPRHMVEMVLAVLFAAMVSGGILKRLHVNAEPQAVFGWLEDQEPLQFAAMVLTACLLAPVCEEFFFRGVVFNAFRGRLGTTGASAAAALVFALIHGNIFAALPLFVMALCLTRAYVATESIWAPVAMHALFNAASLAFWAMMGVSHGL